MATAQLGAVLRHVRSLAANPAKSEQTDRELLRAFLSHNDQLAFEALLRRHGAMVLRVCRRTLGNSHDAEDALQATFLLLARRGHAIRKTESLANWLHGAAYRMATHARRAAARRHKHESRAQPIQPRDPALSAAWREIQVLLDEEVAGLSETLRASFVLCCLENKSCAEAAHELGLKEGTVWNRLGRARKRLQERLTRRGVSLTTVLAAVAVEANRAAAAMSRSLVQATVQAAAQVAAGQPLEGTAVSVTVMTLVKGVNQAMFLSKCKTAMLVLLCTTIVGTGLGLAARHRAAAAPPPAPQALPPGALAASRKEQPQTADAPAKTEATEVKVRGLVLDPDGKPFAGAKVYVGYARRQERTYSPRATSGDDGHFEFTFGQSGLEKAGAGDGPWVMAVADGHGCNWAKVGPAEKDLTLRLVKDVPISGRILDPEGRPVARAKLTVMGVTAAKDVFGIEAFRWWVQMGFRERVSATQWTGSLPGQPAVRTTGADGRFKLSGVGRDRVIVLRLEGPAIASADLAVKTLAGDKFVLKTQSGEEVGELYGASFDHPAAVSRPIRGVVRDRDTGRPLAGVTVGPPTDQRFKNPLRKAVTDKEGRYQLLGLAKSPSYSLRLKPPDGLYLQRSTQLKDPGGLDALVGDFELVQGGVTVRGKVTDKATGKPIVGAMVHYQPVYRNPNVNKKLSGGWSPRSEATTGPDGSYVLTVLPGPGVIGVIGTLGPDLEKYMPAHVTREEVNAFFKSRAVIFGLAPDAGGNAAGTMELAALHNAYVLLEPDENDKALVKDVALEAPQERKGRVVGPDGQPLAGVEFRGRKTSAGGECTLRGLNPRQGLKVIFYHKEKKLGFFLKEPAGQKSEPLVIKLQPCGSVSGRLVDPDGQPLANKRMHIDGLERFELVNADKEGRFRIEGLVPGVRYMLTRQQLPEVNYELAQPSLAYVSVEPGQTKDLGDVKVEH